MNIIIFRIKCLLVSPVYLVFLLYKHDLLVKELRRWEEVLPVIKYKNDFFAFIRMFAALKEYRTLFFFRTGKIGEIISIFIPHLRSVYFISKNNQIGGGLILQHGFSTIIFAEKIGENCQIWHNVTIGRARDKQRCPKIGDNVKICAGAIVLGDITIGDNVTIAAGSVIVKDVPPNSLVCGNPAYICKKNGIKTYEKLK